MFDHIDSLLPDLAALYEDLHAHPELSFQEVRTAGILADRLEALGFDVAREVGRTGVVAVMENGTGSCVLLRADIDALPVKEATGLPYASEVMSRDADGHEVPVAHACGHDMHAAWMIGVATLLANHRDQWQGRVMIVLQPAEEIGSGADAMVDDGLFERFGTPDVALGQHVAPAPAGMVLHRADTMMAASDAVAITMHGRGGHGSRPETTVDPAVMAASTVMKLQTVVARSIAATDVAVVTVGTIKVGTKENIISDRAELTLSIRSFDPHVRDKVFAAIERIVHGEAHSCGAEKDPEIVTTYSFPPLRNDPESTRRVAEAFRAHLGPERTLESPLITGSEDFGKFGERGGFPSVFWLVGGHDADEFLSALAEGRMERDIPTNHSPNYAPLVHPTLKAGIEAMLVAASCWLAPAA